MHNVKNKKIIETYCLFETSTVLKYKWIKIKNIIIAINKYVLRSFFLKYKKLNIAKNIIKYLEVKLSYKFISHKNNENTERKHIK